MGFGIWHCTMYLFCASCGTTGGSFGVLKTTLRGIFWRKVLGKSCWYCYYPLLIWKITEKWSKGKIFKKYILGGLGNTPLEGLLEKKFQAKVVCIYQSTTNVKKTTKKVQREKSFFFLLLCHMLIHSALLSSFDFTTLKLFSFFLDTYLRRTVIRLLPTREERFGDDPM